jgi:hypothetical protein
MNVITLKQHRYRGQLKKVGQEYDCVGRMFRKVARALGWVAVVPPVSPIPEKPIVVQEVVNKIIAGEKILAAEEAKETTKPKRTYRRRNLTAEE